MAMLAGYSESFPFSPQKRLILRLTLPCVGWLTSAIDFSLFLSMKTLAKLLIYTYLCLN